MNLHTGDKPSAAAAHYLNGTLQDRFPAAHVRVTYGDTLRVTCDETWEPMVQRYATARGWVA
jgi:hypothetical protein